MCSSKSHVLRFPVLFVCCASVLLGAQAATATIVLDQEQATGPSGASGAFFWGQTFKPSFNNVSGAQVFVSFSFASITPDTRLRLRLLDAVGGTELASGSTDIPDGSVSAFVQVNWPPVAVTPETEYFLEVAKGNQIGFATVSPYTRGQFFIGGSGATPGPWALSPSGADADLRFRTFSDDAFVPPVPSPAAALMWLTLLGSLAMTPAIKRNRSTA